MRLRSRVPAGRQQRWLRIRVVLASGIVLGVGAAGTLAAWNDAEYTQVTFKSGMFGIEGAADDDDFSEHDSSDTAAQLVFSTPTPAMVPGTKTYAGYRIRTVPGSVAGEVRINTPQVVSDSGLAPQLTYGVRVIPSDTDCDADSYRRSARPVVASGTALTIGSETWQELPAGSKDSAPGDAVNYCLELMLKTDAQNSAQGKSAVIAWAFFAQNTYTER